MLDGATLTSPGGSGILPAMSRPWNPDPVCHWLLDEGRLLPDIDSVIEQLGQKMLLAGAPIWRLRLAMRTLHPLITALSAIWERDGNDTEIIETPHGIEGRPEYVGSPIEFVSRTRKLYRKRLDRPLEDRDSPILHELRQRGATDYVAFPLPFGDGGIAILVLVSDTAGGFSDGDIEQFERIGRPLAPVVEVFRTRRIAQSVARAYLGRRTGQHVLDGRIIRGDVETIQAAILMSDIRDWSGLNNRLPAAEVLELANRFFEVVGAAIEGHGGEILKFIGDAVLAVFPADTIEPKTCGACDRALLAAQETLKTTADIPGLENLHFGMGLHYGEVMYGNIGSATRLDFTVMGRAVNIAARIEGLCSVLGRPLLLSEDFCDRLSAPAREVERTDLKGHSGTFGVYVPMEKPANSTLA